MEVLAQATWRDVLDVALLALTLSWLYQRLRSSRALGIAMGLASFALIALATRELGLQLTSWVLQGTVAVVALGAVTIFTPEIREALFSANPLRSIVGRRGRPENDAYLSRFANACFALAATRTGALIVFERADSLDVVREGIRMDAEPSEELLVSLFQKTAPTHDGAVVVRAGRIERAGAYLPLSDRDNLPRYYGTRHRAAFGLSELRDAVVLVVSEERGTVSLVSRGSAAVVSGPVALVGRLRAELAGEAGGGRRPGRPLLAGYKAKLAILVAVGLVWMGIRSGGVSSVTLTVPVEFKDLPEGTELLSFSPERVRVQVSGAERVMSALDLADVRVRADLRGVTAGEHQEAMPLSAVSVPTGVRAVSIEPSTLRFQLDRVESRELPVTVVIRRDGKRYAARRLTAEPASVRVEGAASRLEVLDAIMTETIDLADLARGPVRAPLELPGTLRLSSGEPDRVTVSDLHGSEHARAGL